MTGEMDSLRFDDASDQGRVWIGVRAQDEKIELTVSLERDGDVSVWMTPEIARELASLLREVGSRIQ